MNRISLISTAHQEKGLANSGNLYSILKHLKPEVIFLELPSDHYDYYFTTYSLRTLESDSVNMYRKDNPVEIVLVDSKAPNTSLRDDIDFLFKTIDSNSDRLESIGRYIHQFTCQYGFPYLNSMKHQEHLSAQREEELNTIKSLNDPKLRGLYELWENIHKQRENEILNNIQKYSGNHSFNQAVFLVGSAHSQSIIEKAKEKYSSSPLDIQLFFYSREELVNSNEA